jgi:hypothetical protein
VAGRLSGRERISIATAQDFPLFEFFLDEWLATLDPIHILEVDVSEDDSKYTQLAPALMSEIVDKFGKI